MVQPKGIKLLTAWLVLTGILTLGGLIFFGGSAKEAYAYLGLPANLMIMSRVFTGALALAAGIGLGMGKKWGWWVTAISLGCTLFANIDAILFTPTTADALKSISLLLMKLTSKYTLRLLINLVFFIYLFKDEVLEYFDLLNVSLVRKVVISMGIALILFGSFSVAVMVSQGDGVLEDIARQFADAEYDEAFTRLEQYIEKHPKNAKAHELSGSLYLELDLTNEAKEAYTSALELNPASHVALTGLGIISRIDGDYEQAMAYYEKAVEVRPDYAQTYSSMVLIELLRYNDAKALEYGEKAYSLDRFDSSVMANLAVAYHYNGRLKERDELTNLAETFGYEHIKDLYALFEGQWSLREEQE